MEEWVRLDWFLVKPLSHTSSHLRSWAVTESHGPPAIGRHSSLLWKRLQKVHRCLFRDDLRDSGILWAFPLQISGDPQENQDLPGADAQVSTVPVAAVVTCEQNPLIFFCQSFINVTVQFVSCLPVFSYITGDFERQYRSVNLLCTLCMRVSHFLGTLWCVFIRFGRALSSHDCIKRNTTDFCNTILIVC
jgi:hypothetical protein